MDNKDIFIKITNSFFNGNLLDNNDIDISLLKNIELKNIFFANKYFIKNIAYNYDLTNVDYNKLIYNFYHICYPN